MNQTTNRQRRFFGPGTVHHVKDHISGMRATSVLLVTGANLFSLSGAEQALAGLDREAHVVRFDDYSPNPKLEDAEKGLALFRRQPCDVIVAVGGGSAMDMAKLIAIFSAHQTRPSSIVNGDCPIENKGPPVIAVPTTSGSGSEATHFAVVYAKGKKHSVAHEFIRPDIAIVDPELSYTLPPRLTAVSGLDVVSQAMESLWSVNSTDASLVDSRRALRLAFSNLSHAVHSPSPEFRQAMSEAAFLAGKAIDVTKTTAPHAISYTLTSEFGVPHGLAVALTLGELLIYNSRVSEGDVNDPRGIRHVLARIDDINQILGCRNATQSAAKIAGLVRELGLPTRLSDAGIQTSAHRRMIRDNVNIQRLGNNPRMITAGGLDTVLKKVA